MQELFFVESLIEELTLLVRLYSKDDIIFRQEELDEIFEPFILGLYDDRSPVDEFYVAVEEAGCNTAFIGRRFHYQIIPFFREPCPFVFSRSKVADIKVSLLVVLLVIA